MDEKDHWEWTQTQSVQGTLDEPISVRGIYLPAMVTPMFDFGWLRDAGHFETALAEPIPAQPLPDNDLQRLQATAVSREMIEAKARHYAECDFVDRDRLENTAFQWVKQAVDPKWRAMDINAVLGSGIRLEFRAEAYTPIAAPLYLLVYQYQERRYMALVNGLSGVLVGQRPLSPWKTLLNLGYVLMPAAGLLALSALFPASDGGRTLLILGLIALGLGIFFDLVILMSLMGGHKAGAYVETFDPSQTHVKPM